MHCLCLRKNVLIALVGQSARPVGAWLPHPGVASAVVVRGVWRCVCVACRLGYGRRPTAVGGRLRVVAEAFHGGVQMGPLGGGVTTGGRMAMGG